MKNDVMEYKDYWTNIHYSVDDRCLYGKIEGINDLISFGSENIADIEKEFHNAVDEYLAFCEEVGKEPEKAYKGSFNIRMEPELHRQISKCASSTGKTLNQFMVSAARHELALAMANDAFPPQK